MAKQGMKRPEPAQSQHNRIPPVPEIEGKGKHGKARANPIIAGTVPPEQKVYHTSPHRPTWRRKTDFRSLPGY